ncbi:MAG: ABC transporter substrate-binding protein, partial [Bacillota bacterium]
MKYKKISLYTLIILLLSLLWLVPVLAEEIIDPKIPESWYEEPKLASELGITEFNQSPVLEEKVNNGILPPVEDRLPDDPPVIEPYESVGKYGGTVTSWDRSLFYYESGYFNTQNNSGGTTTPDGSKIVPNLLKDWEYSEDYTQITLYLRKGLKWSDGEPVTADDYLYWWEHYAQNRDLEPVPPEEWRPGLLNVEKVNDWTVTLSYDTSIPNEHVWFKNHMGANWSLAPAHYMKEFHPDFVGEDQVKEMAEKVGLERWEEYYGRIQDDSWQHPEYENTRPVLNPYVATERTETHVILERNPYFPFVDTEGNQLPYIDKIRINLVNSSEMASTKAATGDATFAARHPQTSDIPLFRRNEEKEDYTTLIYKRAYGAEVSIRPNLTHKDTE